jgi:hypothetical protein
MAIANPSADIITIEGCKNTSEIAKNLFKRNDLNNINLINSTFTDYFEKLRSESGSNSARKYDLIYVDGNHNEEETIQYFNYLLNHIHERSVIIFDDIYWSAPMTQAWKIIIDHPDVIVSIDTFNWGILFFKQAFKQASNDNRKNISHKIVTCLIGIRLMIKTTILQKIITT